MFDKKNKQGLTKLHKSVLDNDIISFYSILENDKNVNINSEDIDGISILQSAIKIYRNNKNKITKEIIEKMLSMKEINIFYGRDNEFISDYAYVTDSPTQFLIYEQKFDDSRKNAEKMIINALSVENNTLALYLIKKYKKEIINVEDFYKNALILSSYSYDKRKTKKREICFNILLNELISLKNTVDISNCKEKLIIYLIDNQSVDVLEKIYNRDNEFINLDFNPEFDIYYKKIANKGSCSVLAWFLSKNPDLSLHIKNYNNIAFYLLKEYGKNEYLKHTNIYEFFKTFIKESKIEFNADIYGSFLTHINNLNRKHLDFLSEIKGFNINLEPYIPSYYQYIPLYTYLYNGYNLNDYNNTLFNWMVDNKYDFNINNKKKENLLHRIVYVSDDYIVKAIDLIKNILDKNMLCKNKLNEQNEYGRTFISLLIRESMQSPEKFLNVLKFAVENGYDLTQVNTYNSNNILHDLLDSQYEGYIRETLNFLSTTKFDNVRRTLVGMKNAEGEDFLSLLISKPIKNVNNFKELINFAIKNDSVISKVNSCNENIFFCMKNINEEDIVCMIKYLQSLIDDKHIDKKSLNLQNKNGDTFLHDLMKKDDLKLSINSIELIFDFAVTNGFNYELLNNQKQPITLYNDPKNNKSMQERNCYALKFKILNFEKNMLNKNLSTDIPCDTKKMIKKRL